MTKIEVLAPSIEELELSCSRGENAYAADDLSPTSEAEAGTRAEKALGFRQALYRWPRAVLWAVVFGSSIVMEGYDLALIGAFWGYPTFQKQFGYAGVIREGYDTGRVEYQVSAAWQSGLQSGVAAMSMGGVLLGGSLAQKYGYRPVFIGALCSIMILVFGTVFSRSMPSLLVAELLLGLPWGVLSSLGPAYASEIAPLALRAYLTTYVNLCWLFGQLIAAGILKALLTRDDQWSYRVPFALQWIWPLPIALAIILAPESPWYLVRTGQLTRAKVALERCCRQDRGVNIDDHLAMMVHTNELERRINLGTSYKDCLRGLDLRRTEISCMAWGIQQFCGSPFGGQAIYFFTVAGISTSTSYSLGVGTYALGICGTMVSWFLMTYYGRRSIYLVGSVLMTFLMLSIGIVAIFAQSSNTALYIQAGVMLAFVFVYNLTVGPVAYTLVAEMSSTRLRAKTVGIARCFYNATGILATVIQPYLINPTAANLQGRVGFIWAVTGALSTIWIYYRLPEPRGRTYEELDVMFLHRIPARDFKTHIARRPNT